MPASAKQAMVADKNSWTLVKCLIISLKTCKPEEDARSKQRYHRIGVGQWLCSNYRNVAAQRSTDQFMLKNESQANDRKEIVRALRW
jgi:hypothetical protein